MSWALVSREQAEEYAKENNVALLEAKDILNETRNFRIRPARYNRLKFDQDGFYIGTERMNFKDRFHCWKFYVWRRYFPYKNPKRDETNSFLDDCLMELEQMDEYLRKNK